MCSMTPQPIRPKHMLLLLLLLAVWLCLGPTFALIIAEAQAVLRGRAC